MFASIKELFKKACVSMMIMIMLGLTNVFSFVQPIR